MFLDAIAYPFRGSGWIMILLGAGMVLLLKVAAFAPFIGGISAFLGSAYFMAFYFDIIVTTAGGRDETPDWPDVSDLVSDIILPWVQWVGVLIVSCLPLVAVVYFVDHDADYYDYAEIAALAFIVIYFPMALLSVAVSGSLMSALPHKVLPAIFRCLPGYLLVVGLLILVVVVSGVMVAFLPAPPLVGWALSALVSLYFAMVECRLVGMIYRRNEAVLEW